MGAGAPPALGPEAEASAETTPWQREFVHHVPGTLKVSENRRQRRSGELLEPGILARIDLVLHQNDRLLMVDDLALHIGDIERRSARLLQLGQRGHVITIEFS